MILLYIIFIGLSFVDFSILQCSILAKFLRSYNFSSYLNFISKIITKLTVAVKLLSSIQYMIKYRVTSKVIKIHSFGELGERKGSCENSNGFFLNPSGGIPQF